MQSTPRSYGNEIIMNFTDGLAHWPDFVSPWLHFRWFLEESLDEFPKNLKKNFCRNWEKNLKWNFWRKPCINYWGEFRQLSLEKYPHGPPENPLKKSRKNMQKKCWKTPDEISEGIDGRMLWEKPAEIQDSQSLEEL